MWGSLSVCDTLVLWFAGSDDESCPVHNPEVHIEAPELPSRPHHPLQIPKGHLVNRKLVHLNLRQLRKARNLPPSEQGVPPRASLFRFFLRLPLNSSLFFMSSPSLLSPLMEEGGWVSAPSGLCGGDPSTPTPETALTVDALSLLKGHPNNFHVLSGLRLPPKDNPCELVCCLDPPNESPQSLVDSWVVWFRFACIRNFILGGKSLAFTRVCCFQFTL